MAEGKPYKDFTGLQVRTWTVIDEAGFMGGEHMRWLVRCQCGREQVKASGSICNWQGYCVCTGGRPNNTHPLYGTWANMKHRCLSKKSKNYALYGGRGITICDRWLGRLDGFSNFVEDVGPRPDGATLDRINPNGNYEPGNVRWATPKEQTANRRCSAPRIAAVLDQVEAYLRKHPEMEYTGLEVIGVIRCTIFGDNA